MKYKVKLEKAEEGYAVWCPGLPGCWSQGATENEALENITDAIETYLATVEELTKGQMTRLVEIPAGHVKIAGHRPSAGGQGLRESRVSGSPQRQTPLDDQW